MSSSTNRLSHDRLYFAIVVFDVLGAKCVAPFSSRYAFGVDAGRPA